MRKFLTDLFSFKMARHQQHSRLIQTVGAPFRHVHRSHVMFAVSAVALAAELFRRRRHTAAALAQVR